MTVGTTPITATATATGSANGWDVLLSTARFCRSTHSWGLRVSPDDGPGDTWRCRARSRWSVDDMGKKRHLSTVVRPPGGGGVDVDRAQMGETSTDAGRRPPVERGLVGDLLKAMG